MLTILTFAWLPLRLALLVGLYLHRAATEDLALPLTAMNQFLSPWVLLMMLAVPVWLAWRWARLPESRTSETPPDETETQPSEPNRRHLAAALISTLAAAAVVTFLLTWDPAGSPRARRVTVVERHSTWEPTTEPYSTTRYGELASYNYAAIYDYLSQFFETSRLLEDDKIDDATLAECDVLVIKTPTDRYQTDGSGRSSGSSDAAGGCSWWAITPTCF